MSPSLAAFADEMCRIKVAAEKNKFKSEVGPKLKRRAVSAAKWGLGFGTGVALSDLIGNKLLPKLLPTTTPAQRKVIGGVVGGLGAVAALGTWNSMAAANEAEKKKK